MPCSDALPPRIRLSLSAGVSNKAPESGRGVGAPGVGDSAVPRKHVGCRSPPKRRTTLRAEPMRPIRRVSERGGWSSELGRGGSHAVDALFVPVRVPGSGPVRHRRGGSHLVIPPGVFVSAGFLFSVFLSVLTVRSRAVFVWVWGEPGGRGFRCPNTGRDEMGQGARRQREGGPASKEERGRLPFVLPTLTQQNSVHTLPLLVSCSGPLLPQRSIHSASDPPRTCVPGISRL